jgi:uncharacterized protein YprB with RNaseH-like and TPR domain
MVDFYFDIETTGLHSIEDRILCISVMNTESNIPITFYGEDERKTLEQFLTSVKNSEKLIGFNIDTFDVPFIVCRCLVNTVNIGEFLNKNFIDLRKVVSSFKISRDGYYRGTLREWANHCDYIVISQDGSHMNELYLAKNWKEIKKHNEEDVFILKLLYERCKFCGVIK